jgi:uncharacterized protein (TIGR03083 family)
VRDGDIDYGAAYRALRARVVGLVTHASDDQLETPTPATPDWRTRDVLAHLAGVPADILAGRLDGVATDAWTQAQVDARRDRSVGEIVGEWKTTGPQVDPMISSFGSGAGQFTADAVTHEHDIRGALDEPGARASDAVRIAYAWIGDLVAQARSAGGAGALRIDTEAGSDVFGEGAPTASATITRFELLRAATGRRSLTQIESWEWEGDARADLVVLSLFRPRAEPLVE